MKRKKDKIHVRVALDKELAEMLRREFGSIGKALRELGKRYEWSIGPKDPWLREAWHALLQNSEAQGKIKYKNAIEVLTRDLAMTVQKAQETLGELSALGYIETVETGILKIHEKRMLPDLSILFMLGLGGKKK